MRSCGTTPSAARAALVVGAALVVSLLAGCADGRAQPALPQPPPVRPDPSVGGTGGATAPPGAFTVPDIVYMQQMVPHHDQTLGMASTALGASDDPEIRALAQDLISDHEPEVVRMRRWLTALGLDVAAGGGHAHGPVPDDRPGRLDDVRGEAFDSLFVDLVITHGVAAVQVSRDEVRAGGHEELRRIAADVAAREAERIVAVERMR